MSGARHHTTGSPEHITVVVVGGGIAGLSAAWALASAPPAVRVVVLEADARLGGKLRTGEVGGRAVDLGPDAFLARRPEAVALCRELGLGDALVSPGRRNAYVWARGALRPLPEGLAVGVPTRLGALARSGILTPLGVGRAALDLTGWPPTRRHTEGGDGDHTVADITRRRLGRQVTERLVDPLIGGIHAGNTTHMSAAAVFPALHDAAARGGSLMRALRSAAVPMTAPSAGGGDDDAVFHTLRGGLARLVESLAGALSDRGVEIRLGAPVDQLERRHTQWELRTPQGTIGADAVVIATPAKPAAALLEQVDLDLASLLGEIAYSNVTLVTLQVPENGIRLPLHGTGFLVPATAGRFITACTWLTSKWPDLQRPGDILLRASMGRFGDDRATEMSDTEVVAAVLDDLKLMSGLEAHPTEAVVTRWADAFPQYGVGHVALVTAIEEAVARLPALALAGAAFHGVGIPACIASGRRAAAAVLGGPVLARTATR
jgi:protoporphyrinogen/coproporphyrinogen III oxidase